MRYCLGILAALLLGSAHAQIPIIPGAVGFGMETWAGSGRHNMQAPTIYRVTSLANSGAGTLRECMSASGTRVCIFETSGSILLTSDIVVTSPYLTVAGQTAPAPGITVEGASIRLQSKHILLQHFRVRPGDRTSGPSADSRDAIVIQQTACGSFATEEIVLSNMTLTWGIDENFSIYTGACGTAIRNVTVRRSLIAEALHQSIHSKGRHSLCSLTGPGGDDVLYHENVYGMCWGRNPYQTGGSHGIVASSAIMTGTHPNNSDGKAVLFHIGSTSFTDGGWDLSNVIYESVPGALPTTAMQIDSTFAPNKVYKDRVSCFDELGAETTNCWTGVTAGNTANSPHYPTMLGDLNPTLMRMTDLLPLVGARPAEPNVTDDRIKNELSTRNAVIKDDPPEAVNLAVNTRALTTPPDLMGDDNGDGYTNFENWLHGYSDAVETQPPVLPITVPFRINSGGVDYTDAAGDFWQADWGSNGGTTGRTGVPINGTPDQDLYQPFRRTEDPSLIYSFPIENGSYDVKVLYTEAVNTGPGQRVFDVLIEGVMVDQDLDIWAEAGQLNAYSKDYENNTVSDGEINIQFDLGSASFPLIRGFEIDLPGAVPPPTPINTSLSCVETTYPSHDCTLTYESGTP